jgi:hypothetical protein
MATQFYNVFSIIQNSQVALTLELNLLQLFTLEFNPNKPSLFQEQEAGKVGR